MINTWIFNCRTFSAPMSNFRTSQSLKNPNTNFRTFQDPWEPWDRVRSTGSCQFSNKFTARICPTAAKMEVTT